MICSFTVKLDLQSCWTDNLKVILFKENKIVPITQYMLFSTKTISGNENLGSGVDIISMWISFFIGVFI